MRSFELIWRDMVRAAAAWSAKWGKYALPVVRWGIPILLLAILARSMTQIGWLQVWQGRPRSLWFYLVLFVPFFIQPAADLLIYRNLLKVGRALPFTVLLRKRYLNAVMLDYSGEAYFFLWARHNLTLTRKNILVHAVKDSNVLSAGAGLVMMWLMLFALFVGGVVKLPAALSGDTWMLISGGSIPLVLCLALIAGGRKVTSLSRVEIVTTFAIHLARSVATLAFDFWLWWLSGALPSAALCLEFVALRLLVTRLPLVPNKDLVFIGVGMAAAGLLDLSAPKVTATLVLITGAGQLQEFALVGLPWLIAQFRVRRRPHEALP